MEVWLNMLAMNPYFSTHKLSWSDACILIARDLRQWSRAFVAKAKRAISYQRRWTLNIRMMVLTLNASMADVENQIVVVGNMENRRLQNIANVFCSHVSGAHLVIRPWGIFRCTGELPEKGRICEWSKFISQRGFWSWDRWDRIE